MRRLAPLLAVAGLLAACGGSGGATISGTTATAVGGANGAHATVTSHTATTRVKPVKLPPQSKAAHAALAAFVACMRAHGQRLSAPSSGGSGPIFDTSHVDTSSKAYQKAAAACHHTLSGLTAASPSR